MFPLLSAVPGLRLIRKNPIKTFGADFVVIGEGELVFPQLIDAINKKLPTESIPGTASMVNGNIKINPGRYLTEDELNALPFPAWELLDHKLYAKMHSVCQRWLQTLYVYSYFPRLSLSLCILPSDNGKGFQKALSGIGSCRNRRTSLQTWI